MKRHLRSLLLSDSGIKALVERRVNYLRHKQGAPLPAILLHVITDPDEYNLSDVSDFAQGRVQIDCDGADYVAASELEDAVRALLSGYSDDRFQGVFLAGRREGDGPLNSAGEPGFRISLDFTISYNKT